MVTLLSCLTRPTWRAETRHRPRKPAGSPSSWVFFDPDLACRRMLQLPDGSDLLQLVDGPFTRPKRVSTVFRARDDQHDVFTDHNCPEAMNDQQFKNVEILQRPRPYFPQFPLSHPLVMLEG